MDRMAEVSSRVEGPTDDIERRARRGRRTLAVGEEDK